MKALVCLGGLSRDPIDKLLGPRSALYVLRITVMGQVAGPAILFPFIPHGCFRTLIFLIKKRQKGDCRLLE